MPIYPPRSEPVRKIEVLEKREMELLKSIRTNASEEKLNNRAKKVREAQLNLIKAKLALIRPYKSEEINLTTQKLRSNLGHEAEIWERKSTNQIISEYKKVR